MGTISKVLQCGDAKRCVSNIATLTVEPSYNEDQIYAPNTPIPKCVPRTNREGKGRDYCETMGCLDVMFGYLGKWLGNRNVLRYGQLVDGFHPGCY